MANIEHETRIERAIREGEEVLHGALGEPDNEEAWADLANQVIGDLADDYRGAVALREDAERWIERYDHGPADAVNLLADARALLARLTGGR